MTVVDRIASLNAEGGKELSLSRGESPAVQDLRWKAWNAYDNFPMPSREDEAWRRTDISRLNLEEFHFSLDPLQTVPTVPSLFYGVVGPEEGSLLIQDSSVHRRIPHELSERRVVLTDLPTALREHGALIEKRIQSAVPPRRGKFESLNGAFWNTGVFLYVPRGEQVRPILRGGHGSSMSAGSALLPRTLIVLEEGARATYIDEYVSPSVPGDALAAGAVEIFLGPGAELTYVNIQRWGNNVWHFLSQNAHVDRDAKLTTLAVALGGRLSKVNLGSELLGQGAASYLYGLVFGDGAQHFTHHTFQDHQVPNTTSDLLFKAALKDQAHSIYTGMIRITKEAQKTTAYQTNRNLLLSPGARANTIPMLEILADDVKCGHGASVGALDEDQRFYLMSRGLSRAEAERAIVEGFFEEVLQRIPVSATREKLHLAIDDKLAASSARAEP